MTEQEWLACTEPTLMLGHLQQCGLPRTKAGRRKLLLHGVACCRRVWELLPDTRFRKAVHVLEQYADGGVEKAALEKALAAAKIAVTALKKKNRGAMWKGWYTWMGQDAAAEMVIRALGGGSVKVAHKVSGLVRTAFYWAALVEADAKKMEFKESIAFGQRAQANGSVFACSVFRELVPFQPVTLDSATQTVVTLAQAAYDERLPSGELDPSRLAALAKALKKSDPELVKHLRGPGQHYRGCWVVDSLLGKS